MQYLETSSHLEPVLDPKTRKDVLAKLEEKLQEFDLEKPFSAIAVCGASGLLVGPTLADRLGKNVVLVRKHGEPSHSLLTVEGPKDDNYVVVDDLISTGGTICHIVQSIRQYCEYSKCVGILLYNIPSFQVPRKLRPTKIAWLYEIDNGYWRDLIENY